MASYEVRQAPPLSVQVADILREKILQGELQLGQRINEVEVANALGISRTPLREGLRTLAEEQLVTLVGGKGVFVASFPIREIEELLELRPALDVLAIRLACERATDDQLDRLETTLENVTAAHHHADRAVPWTSDFHMSIFDIAGNGKLREHGRAVHTQLRLARFRSGSVPARLPAAHREHVAILEALRSRDAAEAERRVREHHARGATHILQTLSESQQ